MPDQQQDDPGQQDDAGEAAGSTDVEGGQDDAGMSDVATVRREAASYRRKLRAVETERDHLTGVVSTMSRAEAERRAEVRMHRGDDLWAAGVTLEELLDEETGGLDFAKVDAAIGRVLEERPHWGTRRPAGDADQGARGASTAPDVDFAEMLRRAGAGQAERG